MYAGIIQRRRVINSGIINSGGLPSGGGSVSLVSLDGMPLVAVGTYIPTPTNTPAFANVFTMNTANAAVIGYGHIITEDGASHTIDTTGSSSLQWQAGGAGFTWANGGSTLKVGLGVMDAGGPPGRAANAAGVITQSVSKTYTGGAGLSANTWMTSVPDAGSLTIANGDLIAFSLQLTARGGADVVTTLCQSYVTSVNFPGVTSFDGTATYTAQNFAPNILITFSDGKIGWIAGSFIGTTSGTQAWNNGSAKVEYGNFLQLPFPVKVYGMYGVGTISPGSCDFALYSDPLGTPVLQKSFSQAVNVMSQVAGSRLSYGLFPTPYATVAGQPLAAIFKPTSGSNITAPFKTYASASHQKTDHCGVNGYAINRASGAFGVQNSNLDRFIIGFLVGAFGA